MVAVKAFFFHAWISFGLGALVYAVLATEYKRMLIFKEPIPNKALPGHVIRAEKMADEGSCRLKCYLEPNCVSINVGPAEEGKHTCELNNATDESPSHSHLEKRQGYKHNDVENFCHGNPCPEKNTICQVGITNKGYRCVCREGYTGDKCEATRGWYSHDPGKSCKDVRDFGSSKGDGYYWIDPAESGKPLKVYCDMKTDGGGWLLVSSVVMESSAPPSQLPVDNSYRGIRSKQMLLTKSAMNELRSYLHFTQLRFNCKKKQGRTFHITTAANSSGEAVVRYFSGQTDVQPPSCCSFVIMNDDNSRLAQACQKWGYYKVGKWGIGADKDRLYNHPVFEEHAHHWIAGWRGRWECDDQHVRVSPGDFWKVFVR